MISFFCCTIKSERKECIRKLLVAGGSRFAKKKTSNCSLDFGAKSDHPQRRLNKIN
jgi:hypothetical protein